VCSRFHHAVRQLRQREDDRLAFEIEDEEDVLDLLRVLLCIDFDEIEVKTWSPGYAPTHPHRALHLVEDGVVVLAKRTGSAVPTKVLRERIAEDLRHHAEDKECRSVFCFVYDPEGRIGNPRRLEADFTREEKGVSVEVLVAPK
jgi:hypothetical protein